MYGNSSIIRYNNIRNIRTRRIVINKIFKCDKKKKF